MTERYVTNLQLHIEAHANPEKAAPMKKYMRDQFEFLGIPSPELKSLFKEFLSIHGLPEFHQLEQVIKDLWKLPQREYQYIALAFLDKMKKNTTKEFIHLYEYLATEKSWWDTVDSLAGNLIGVFFTRYPQLTSSITGKWIESDNIWLARSAILFQLKYKQKTDTDLLFTYILKQKDSAEFFIQKAIGWALREYSKTDPQAVINFVNKNTLASLSTREALKVISKKNRTIVRVK